VRESPAFPIIRKLKIEGARLTAYDPVALPEWTQDLMGVDLAGILAGGGRQRAGRVF